MTLKYPSLSVVRKLFWSLGDEMWTITYGESLVSFCTRMTHAGACVPAGSNLRMLGHGTRYGHVHSMLSLIASLVDTGTVGHVERNLDLCLARSGSISTALTLNQSLLDFELLLDPQLVLIWWRIWYIPMLPLVSQSYPSFKKNATP